MRRRAGGSIRQPVGSVLPEERAQHAIHEACCPLVTEAPRQGDGLIYSRPMRHAFHPQALIHAEAQGVTNPWGQGLEWTPTHVSEEPVNSALPAYDAIDAVRDKGAVAKALDKVRKAAQNGDNTMPFTVEAVRAYATLGEICSALRDVYGVYEEPAI